MKSKYSIVGYLVILLYLLIHFLTLSLFPLPWYDETYMASIGKSFLETGEFTKTLAYYTDDPKIDLRYGPVYFFVVAGVFKTLGTGIFQYRLISLLTGLWTIWLTFRLVRQESVNRHTTAYAIIFMLGIDSFYFRCMHEGRMDFLASGFMLCASLLLLNSVNQNKNSLIYKKLIFAGVLTGLGLLTSPRVGYSLPFIGGYLLFIYLKNKPRQTLSASLYFLVPLFLIYSTWIFYAFGGYSNFVDFYLENLGYTRLNGYPYYFPKQQLPLLFTTFFVVVFGIIRLKKKFFSPLVIWSLLHILAYYLIVYDNGPYASLIYPYLYIVLFYQIDENMWSSLKLKLSHK